MTDPTHPLFGRRFPLLSVSNPSHGKTHAFALYREYMTLKIPLSSTNFMYFNPLFSAKLSLQSLQELISIIKDCEELCHLNQNTSGKLYPQNCKDK